MVNRKFSLLENEVNEILNSILGEPNPTVRKRLRAVLLHGTNIPIDRIELQIGYNSTEIKDWCQVYRLMGIEGLRNIENSLPGALQLAENESENLQPASTLSPCNMLFYPSINV